jgi:hypothetical protein
MIVKISLAGIVILLIQCTQADKNSLLLGTWKTDSVYTFYNGFGFTKYDFEEEPLHHYQVNDRLVMTREGESRFFSYRIQNDSLVYGKSDKEGSEKFRILKLDAYQLIVRKDLDPIFPGKNQQRYVIRYFSRMKE